MAAINRCKVIHYSCILSYITVHKSENSQVQFGLPSLDASNFLRSVSIADCNLAFSSFAAKLTMNQSTYLHQFLSTVFAANVDGMIAWV